LTAIKSKDLQIFNAARFKKSVSGVGAANVYFTFGRAYAWEDEFDPPLANTSIDAYYEVWDNMIGGKKVTGNNVRHAIPRNNWTSGAIYNGYDNSIDSNVLMNGEVPFYVVTDEWNVYKCISNNYGALSTSKPISISTTSDVQTQDGYIWKYMYTVTAEEQLRFVTDDFIPVRTQDINDQSLQWQVQNNAISGAIHYIKVLEGGTFYANDISVIIKGDGQDANAFAVRDVTSNSISEIVVDNLGINYTYAAISFYSTSDGKGAVARAVISPPGGHGSDPLAELGGSNIIINMTLKNYEFGKLPVTNEYRQIALVDSPLVYNKDTISSNAVVSQTTQIELNGVSSDYSVDEWVFQGRSLPNYTFKGKIVEWDSANNLLKLANVTGKPKSELLIGANTTAARFLSSITYPDLQPRSGKILYIDNILPIERAADQAEDFKLVLKF
jgi:hypothetical protein